MGVQACSRHSENETSSWLRALCDAFGLVEQSVVVDATIQPIHFDEASIRCAGPLIAKKRPVCPRRQQRPAEQVDLTSSPYRAAHRSSVRAGPPAGPA